MTEFLLLAFILLVAGVVSVPIASRFGLGSVLGYFLAGMAIAPLLGFLGVDVVQLQHFAEFGVVMILFIIGLELEPKRLWAMRKRLIGLGGVKDVPEAKLKFSIYSLRHTAICMRIVLGGGKVDIYTLAKNAGTSVEQIERFYAKNLPISAELARNLHHFEGDYAEAGRG